MFFCSQQLREILLYAMNNKPQSRYVNSKPMNECWGCGKLLVIDIRGKGWQPIYDDKIVYGSRVYGYACHPSCNREPDSSSECKN